MPEVFPTKSNPDFRTISNPDPLKTTTRKKKKKKKKKSNAYVKYWEKLRMYVNVKLSDLDHMCENNDPVWVFGYGSLLWKPEFPYSVRETGFISGYKRRFWQGNCTHRGTKDKVSTEVSVFFFFFCFFLENRMPDHYRRLFKHSLTPQSSKCILRVITRKQWKPKTKHSYFNYKTFIIWAASWQNQQSKCAPSEDSDQPGHPPRLRRLRSAWASAQSDQSLRCALSR